jgi:hypothetical protein
VKVYKAVFYSNGHRDENPCIAVLDLPANVRVRLGDHLDSKCRAETAYVVRLESLKGTTLRDTVIAFAGHDHSFKYKAGTFVKPKNGWNTGPAECAGGIHFFFTRKAAVEWATQ